MDSPPSLPPLNSLPPVNWDALDALVLDFVRSDRLVVPPHADADDATCPSPPSSPSSCTTTATSSVPSSSSSSSSSYRSRLLILRARRALEAGDVDAALALLRAHAPAALADHRLLFHLHKQVRALPSLVSIYLCALVLETSDVIVFVWRCRGS